MKREITHTDPEAGRDWIEVQETKVPRWKKLALIAVTGLAVAKGAQMTHDAIQNSHKHRHPDVAHELVVAAPVSDPTRLLSGELAGNKEAQRIAAENQANLKDAFERQAEMVLEAYEANEPASGNYGGVELERNEDGTVTITNYETSAGTNESGAGFSEFATFGMTPDGKVDASHLESVGNTYTSWKGDDSSAWRTHSISFDANSGLYGFSIRTSEQPDFIRTGGGIADIPTTMAELYDQQGGALIS